MRHICHDEMYRGEDKLLPLINKNVRLRGLHWDWDGSRNRLLQEIFMDELRIFNLTNSCKLSGGRETHPSAMAIICRGAQQPQGAEA